MDWCSRLRNYGFWVSLAALVLMFLRLIGVDIVADVPYKDIVDWVLGILVLLGVINNPTTQNRGWLDDSK